MLRSCRQKSARRCCDPFRHAACPSHWRSPSTRPHWDSVAPASSGMPQSPSGQHRSRAACCSRPLPTCRQMPPNAWCARSSETRRSRPASTCRDHPSGRRVGSSPGSYRSRPLRDRSCRHRSAPSPAIPNREACDRRRSARAPPPDSGPAPPSHWIPVGRRWPPPGRKPCARNAVANASTVATEYQSLCWPARSAAHHA